MAGIRPTPLRYSSQLLQTVGVESVDIAIEQSEDNSVYGADRVGGALDDVPILRIYMHMHVHDSNIYIGILS